MPEFVRNVTMEIMSGRGDLLPVSAFPVDGTYPVATAQWEKRNIAQEVPVWEPDLCIECGRSMQLDWSVCAWCAAELAHPALLDAPQVSAAETIEPVEPAEPAEPVFQPQPEAATA